MPVPRLRPTSIPALKRKRIIAVACGSFHTLAVNDSGEVYSWGVGEKGQLGHGDLESRKVPTQVVALQQKVIIAVAAGEVR